MSSRINPDSSTNLVNLEPIVEVEEEEPGGDHSPRSDELGGSGVFVPNGVEDSVVVVEPELENPLQAGVEEVAKQIVEAVVGGLIEGAVGAVERRVLSDCAGEFNGGPAVNEEPEPGALSLEVEFAPQQDVVNPPLPEEEEPGFPSDGRKLGGDQLSESLPPSDAHENVAEDPVEDPQVYTPPKYSPIHVARLYMRFMRVVTGVVEKGIRFIFSILEEVAKLFKKTF